ncbi:hypothetical protein Trydic_g13237 [Trypoxylus dichotomus]
MTNQILELMEQRPKKKDDTIGYNNLKRIIKKKIKESKEADIEEKCTEIETLQAKHENFNVHRKVKEITGACRRKHLTRLTKNEGNAIINTVELKDTWKPYIEQLFHDTRPEPPEVVDDTRPYILVKQ